MLARNETIFKWLAYSLCALACAAVQGALLQRISLWGVMPFLYPVLAVLPGLFEGPLSGTVFALAAGVVCDAALPAPLPCFYTLIFPLAALAAALVAQSWVSGGPLCALLCAALALLITDLFHGLVLALTGKAAWAAVWPRMGKEIALTLPCALLAYPLFALVFRRCHRDD